jgi:endonuclease/exonuclease/phosphatase family metal-dependent hydrolase
MPPSDAGGRVLRDGALRAWLYDPTLEEYLCAVVTELSRLPTRASLEASQFWRLEGRRVERILGTIQAGGPEEGELAAQRLRLVHWNILKGVAFDEILRRLQEHPDLRQPDLLLLNEVDVGMARSANLHVADALGTRLGLHWAFVPSYLELTKGPGPEALAPGSNRFGLHGVAILSRTRPLALRACPLPETFDVFGFPEKRYGRRTALFAALGEGLVVVSTHLEVRGSPRGRGEQIAALLQGLEAFAGEEALQGRGVRRVVLGGDLNTHTFDRRGWWRALQAFGRIALNSRVRLRRQLMEPWRRNREPLFAELRRAGFLWDGLNDLRPTASESLDRVEEIDRLPAGLRDAARSLLRRRVPLRLDWFAARGLPPDPAAVRGATVGEWPPGTVPSDHLPIVLEIPR